MNLKPQLDKIKGELRGQRATKASLINIIGEVDYIAIIAAVGSVSAVLTYINSRPQRCRSKKEFTKGGGSCRAKIVSVEVKSNRLIEICKNGHEMKVPIKPGIIRRY